MKLGLTTAPAYLPRIKGKGFCPNPIAQFGIPSYADTVVNPEVEGTSAHSEWWEEQLHYIDNGYTTGGVFIPGRFYFYLNFYPITTVGRGRHLPDYVDIDHEFYELVEDCKLRKKGILVFKARRRGLSEKAGSIMRHGALVKPERYQAAIIAGLEKYSDELYRKFAFSNGNMPPELQLHENTDLASLKTIVGWQEKTAKGNYIRQGSLSEIFGLTVKQDTNVIKGSFFDDAFFEESGQNEKLMASIGAAKKCMTDGSDDYVGTPFVYGTGGDIKKGSKEFKELLYAAEANNFEVCRVYGPRLRKPFYVGATNSKGDIDYDCPNVVKMAKELNLSYEQVLGCEDPEHGTKQILEYRSKVITQANKKLYFDSVQEDPLTDAEMFLSFTGNDYSPEKLSFQELKIMSEDRVGVKYQLDWVRDSLGNPVKPYQVELTAVDENNGKELPEVYIDMYYPPVSFRHKDLYSFGIDSYDIHKSTTSRSQGAGTIMTRRNNFNIPYGRIEANIRCRPHRKEIFYEYCMMMSVLYGTYNHTMIDARSPLIIDYYIGFGLERMLAPRPTAWDTPRTEQYHTYGYKSVTTQMKITMGMVQTWVDDCIHLCQCLPAIADIRDYDREISDGDWDNHDSVMLALIDDFCSLAPGKVFSQDSVDQEQSFATPKWVRSPEGHMVASGSMGGKVNDKIYDDGISNNDSLYLSSIKSIFGQNNESSSNDSIW